MRLELLRLIRELSHETAGAFSRDDISLLKTAARTHTTPRPNAHRPDPVEHTLSSAIAVCRTVGSDRDMVMAVLLHGLGATTTEPDIAGLLSGLHKISSLQSHGLSLEKADNFRRLLMALAQDIRVIIIMIIDRLVLMREINHIPDQDYLRSVALEASCLYAPLAHRLGLYKIKGELEDLSLKYSDRETYTRIAHGLNETKSSREAYIKSFIEPVREKLAREGLQFEIKGRTKSIYSIWNKLRKQQVGLDGIYDLFAIRIILDTPPAQEKADCWKVYSIVSDMYTPNPARLKDWLSIPKSNGYESLHTTVKGPEGKWVEVQIRSQRMDLIAEKGLAAHWKYKGGKSDGGLDVWMNNIRDILETSDGPMGLLKTFSADMYDKEVIVFSPAGDLYRLPLGATVLDFAFAIHSRLGCSCVGAKVNGSPRKITHKLASGDTVEIMTRTDQYPKLDWLAFVVTSKARNKIRQSIKEMEARSGETGRELLLRRFKNRKIEIDEAKLQRVIKKLGFKTGNEFHAALGSETLDPSEVIELYETLDFKPADTEKKAESAEDFSLLPSESVTSGDPLVIGQGVKGINYKLSKCCNPVYGDQVFGFVASEGTVKIHRTSCPNAAYMRQRHPMRIIPVKWSGAEGLMSVVSLHIIGRDDIGIVNNITSIINKERGCTLRSISLETSAGLFSGNLAINLRGNLSPSSLIKKLLTVKGVKTITRQ